jgi:hypothetical protein
VTASISGDRSAKNPSVVAAVLTRFRDRINLLLANGSDSVYFISRTSPPAFCPVTGLRLFFVTLKESDIMKKHSFYLAAVLVMCLLLIGVTLAQRPETDIDPAKHPNLAEAQHHILQAFEKIDEAQKANKDQLGGHAEKAKQLLDQASRELKEAAEFANHHK